MSNVYKKAGKENVCGKEKTIYELDGEKYIKQKGKNGEIYIDVKKYIEKKKAKRECLNPLLDKRLQILNKIMKKSLSKKNVEASSTRRLSSAARKASSTRRLSSAARKASSTRRLSSAARKAISTRRIANDKFLNITNSSSFKLSPGPARTPIIAQVPRRLTLSETRSSNRKIKKQCKVNCEKEGKICNTKTGRCIKHKKEKSVIVKKVKLEVFAERPCKQDCTALNKICKVSTRRCVNPPKSKPKITAANFKPCKKQCGEGKKCNFLSGRCIKNNI